MCHAQVHYIDWLVLTSPALPNTSGRMSIIDLTIGAIEVGVLLATVVFGVVASFVFKYLELGFDDPILVRVMVSVSVRWNIRCTAEHSSLQIFFTWSAWIRS